MVERIAREPFPAFMTSELFGPLAMESTMLEKAGGVPRNTTTFYSRKKGGRVGSVDRSKAHYSCLGGAGAFLSTPSDLARFGSAMQAPLQLDSGTATNYALGWKVEGVTVAGKPERLVGHRGTPMGGAVSLLMFPDLGLVVAIASNIGTSVVDPFAQQLAGVFVVRRPGV